MVKVQNIHDITSDSLIPKNIPLAPFKGGMGFVVITGYSAVKDRMPIFYPGNIPLAHFKGGMGFVVFISYSYVKNRMPIFYRRKR